MTVLTKKEKSKISFQVSLPRYAGYCDCFLNTQIGFRLENQNDESVRFKVRGEGSDLFLPFEKEAEAGFESAVSFTAGKVFSPLFLLYLSQTGPPVAYRDKNAGTMIIIRIPIKIIAVGISSFEFAASPFRFTRCFFSSHISSDISFKKYEISAFPFCIF